jgi:8-oxo-dGTP pyrophosphatase MutT (NUDIX family)
MALGVGFNDEPFVESSPGAFVIPINYAGDILFIREPIIYSGEYTLTLPGGGIKDGENPMAAANRELQEETGYRAEVMFPLGALRPLARHGRWEIHLFLARNLVPSKQIGDEIYQIEVERVPFDEFETLIASGRLRDSTIIAGLYLARRFMAGKLVSGGAPHG